MRPAIKGALFSGLVFPGVGQLVLKRVWQGLAFLAVAIASITVIVTKVVDQTINSLSNMDPNAAMDPKALATIAQQAESAGAGPVYNLAVIVLVICWVWSIADAWLAGKALGHGLREDD